MTKRNLRRPIPVVLVAACALLGGAPAAEWAQSTQVSQTQVSARPFRDVALILEHRYATPVTYEELIAGWPGDMEIRTGARGPVAFAKGGAFGLPEELTPARTPKLDESSLQTALDFVLRLNPDGPRFRILKSRYGLHIIPDTVRNREGAIVQASSPLDAVVSVPEEQRLPSAHVRAICAAVKAATGVMLRLIDPSTDGYFLPNGLHPPQSLAILAEDRQRPYMFQWGASAVSGRDALISLLDHSATTLSWHFACSTATALPEPDCFLYLEPISVEVTGPNGEVTHQRITYDRCTANCPPPRPAPPARPAGQQPLVRPPN